MTIEEIKNKLNTSEYDFLRTNSHLGNNIILLGLGGSHAYGTNVETSDLDLRGIAIRSKEEILTGRDWEQVTSNQTDTTVYSLEKIFKLLISCNPNTIEMLGLKPEHYLYVSPLGQMILDNKQLFLSKKALNSFSGYAMAQLNRLNNKSGRANEEKGVNEARSLKKAMNALKRDGVINNGIVDVKEDKSDISISIRGEYQLEDFVKIAQNILCVHSDYCKSERNEKAIEHDKLGKHQMHLVRLFLMAKDILENGEIITYREKEHDFLMDIRNGKYLIDGITPTKEFMDIVNHYDNELKEIAKKSKLPVNPDVDKINKLMYDINERVIFERRGNDIHSLHI